jgi:hypothetical protein
VAEVAVEVLGTQEAALAVRVAVGMQTAVLLQQIQEEAEVVEEAQALVGMALQVLSLYAIQTPSMPLYQQQVPQL